MESEPPALPRSIRCRGNRVIGLYRLLSWCMPTCIAIATAWGLNRLFPFIHRNENEWLASALLFNLSTTVALGFFDALLRRHKEKGYVPLGRHAGTFLMYQLLVVPFFGFTVVVIGGGLYGLFLKK